MSRCVGAQPIRKFCSSVAIAVLGAVSLPSPSAAAAGDWGLNGTYIATSNGEWAKTNGIFKDQDSIRSTWTISTNCSFPTECTGTVASDWGWTAPIYQTSGVWFVKHVVDNWQPCPDGSAGPGLQVYRFFASSRDGEAADPGSSTLVGADETTGTSGSCGSSKVIFISMPFKLVKAG